MSYSTTVVQSARSTSATSSLSFLLSFSSSYQPLSTPPEMPSLFSFLVCSVWTGEARAPFINYHFQQQTSWTFPLELPMLLLCRTLLLLLYSHLPSLADTLALFFFFFFFIIQTLRSFLTRVVFVCWHRQAWPGLANLCVGWHWQCQKTCVGYVPHSFPHSFLTPVTLSRKPPPPHIATVNASTVDVMFWLCAQITDFTVSFLSPSFTFSCPFLSASICSCLPSSLCSCGHKHSVSAAAVLVCVLLLLSFSSLLFFAAVSEQQQQQQCVCWAIYHNRWD